MKLQLILLFVTLLSFNVHAGEIEDAAKDVQNQSSYDSKCRVFWRHYMKFINSGNTAGTHAFMMVLDDEAPGIIDYCESRRHEYIN